MQEAATPPIRNRVTLAEGLDPARTYLYVNGGLVSVAPDVICAGTDSRGDDFVGIKIRGAWGIFAGCRHDFDFDKARQHWRNNPECLALVEKIIAEAAHRDAVAAQQEAA